MEEGLSHLTTIRISIIQPSESYCSELKYTRLIKGHVEQPEEEHGQLGDVPGQQGESEAEEDS